MAAGISRRTTISGMGIVLAGCAAPPLPSPSPAPPPAAAITVVAAPGSIMGKLTCQGQVFDCMVGRSGILSSKREGDGGTPAGIFSLREVRYRADRLAAPPVTGLPLITTLARDGWCDDPADSNYNRHVTLPYTASAEVLWRADHLYDVLAVIGYNDAPPVPGAGSAIFLHVMRQQAGVGLPTAGCVSLIRDDLLTVLARCGAQSTIHIRTV